MSTVASLNILVTAMTGEANAALKGTQAQLVKTAAMADKSTASMGKGSAAAQSRMAKFAKGSALAVGLIGVASVKMAADFDDSMRNVNSIAGLPEKQFQSLKNSVLDLAGPTAQAPKTLADGMYQLVSSGFDAKESVQILSSSAKAASAGLTDTATATTAVAAVLNAYHRPASDAAQISDDLFQTVNRGVLSFGDLASGIGDVLPFAASLGVGLKEVGAATSTMTKEGISAPETFTRIKSLMQAMIKPSTDMKNSLQQLGVSGGQDLIKKMGGLQPALEALIGTTDGSQEALAKLFPNVRALGGALALTGKNSKSANGDLAAFKDTAGATNKVFAEQQKSFGGQIRKLWAEVSVGLIKIGNQLLPTIIPMVEAIGKGVMTMVNAFSSLPGPVKSAIVVLTLVGAIAVGLAAAFAPAIFSITALTGAIGGLGAAGAAAEVAGVGAAAEGAGIGLAGLAAAAAPYAIALGVGVAATYGMNRALNALFPANHDFSDGVKEVGEATRNTAKDVQTLTAAQQQLKSSQQTLNQLTAQGKGNTKAASQALEQWSQAYVANANAQKQNQANAAKYREGIDKMRSGITDLSKHVKDWQDMAKNNPDDDFWGKQAQDGLAQLKDKQNQLNNSVIAYRRARQGKDPVSSQAAEALSSLRSIAGKKATAKIGVTGTDSSIQAIGLLSAKLKGIAPKKVLKILASSGSAEQALKRLRALLGAVHDKNVKVAAAVNGLSAVKGLISSLASIPRTVVSTVTTIVNTVKHAIPGNAGGTRDFQGGPSIVNEQGPEMAQLGNRMWMLGNGRRGAQLAYVPEHARIFTAKETRDLQRQGFPAFKKGKLSKSEKKQLKQEKKQAAYDSIATNYEAVLSAAELTSGTADDIAALMQLINYYQGVAKNNANANQIKNPIKRKAALDKLKDALDNIKQYQDQLGELGAAGGGQSGDELAAAQALAELYKAQATTSAQRLAVSQAQYGVLSGLPYGGSFANGGTVAGPLGAPRVIVAHGGETVTPQGKNMQLHVIHEDHRTRYIVDGEEVEAKKLDRRTARRARRNLPGQAGALRG